jgi:5'-nucleotidase
MTNADWGRRPGRARVAGRSLAALGLAVLLVAACGGDGGSGASSDDTAPAPEPPPLEVLVTNDDGVDAVGIDALVQALSDDPDLEVTVVAPAANQSGSADKTTSGPVAHTEQKTASGYPAVAVQGYPADTVLVALRELKLTPDLVVSGINVGENIGPLSAVSGTVGAAKVAQRQGLPALAVSQGTDADEDDYAATAQMALDWVHDHRGELDDLANMGQVASLNVPTCPSGEVRGMLDVALSADTTHVGDTVDCESTEEDFEDDVTAFNNGFAVLTPVPS